MNILHTEASLGWGGQEMRILKEAKGMRKRGHVTVFAVMKGAVLGEKARAEGFEVYEVNYHRSFWVFTLFSLLKIIKEKKIDIVNTHSSLDSWIGAIAARILKKKIIRTRHLSTPIKKGLNSKILYGNLADFVVTTCASIAPIIAKQSGKSLARCFSVATGVDPDQISIDPEKVLEFKEKYRIGAEDFLVGTACVMRSWKGIDDLLSAADLLRDVPNLKWVIIGGGHAERHLQKAKELSLEEKVYFTGHLENPFHAMGALDLFLLLSTAHEGVSQAILQAAFLEKALISTKVGGLHEVCIHELTGLNVEPFSPQMVADAVMKIKNNTNLKETFGKRAKELVLNRFTLERTLDEMEKVYAQLVVEPAKL